jgi:hypothetical protein
MVSFSGFLNRDKFHRKDAKNAEEKLVGIKSIPGAETTIDPRIFTIECFLMLFACPLRLCGECFL